MNEQELWKAKQDWRDRIMASKLNHAEKTIAYCIMRRAYGEKLVSYPDTALIMEDGGFSSSGHFTEMRDRLVRSGALFADLDYHTASATTPNYEYTINLAWDGAVAPKGNAVAPVGKSGSTSGKSGSTPGASNTLNNTLRNTSNNTSTDEPVRADAPTVSFDRVELGTEAYLYTMRDVVPSNNESAAPVYFVDLNGVTKSAAVAPEALPQDRPVRKTSQQAADEWLDAEWKTSKEEKV
jgi:hypothetical protein